ncbi:GNAT family N-acetyltransferase [Flavobacterium pygoscelis]|uniref:GNAT family N-acetyltransferase n=1 Tax=Flavobacterium pygoscelis TaxID=2893176 RepID=UPI00249E9B70|nr:GNAT family N-acetyltransferase [Flavobacterium pygoscelis]
MLKLLTKRLILIPFTIEICETILKSDFRNLDSLKLNRAFGWPDAEVLETLPKIIDNLSRVEKPTGFESWMIIKKENYEIIGDLGFKGFNPHDNNIDLGYGIIEEEQKKGYALEATNELIAWAFLNPIVKEITARCLMENEASIHLLKKLNFKIIKQDKEMIYWCLPKFSFNY